ncbi:MAG: 30S ribosomal protein S6 [Candidatus Absconditabacterales bacterium]
MQKYDVVLLVDASLSEVNRKEVVSEFEKLIKTNIVKQDDIGLQQLAYNLGDKAGNDKAYIYSYYIEAEAADLDMIKKNVLYNKSIKRYFIFKMEKNDEFMTFKKTNDELDAVIETWDAKKLGQKVNFFSDKRNAKYINRKAITMLKKYVTRFGNIKPRAYTHNAVGTQKKLKTVILRARELGLIAYTK